MSVESARILFIENKPGDVEWVQQMLAEINSYKINLLPVKSVQAVMEWVEDGNPDAILLGLPFSEGQKLDPLMQMLAAAPHLPVVVLADSDSEDLAVQAVQTGAQDYLVKDQVDGELLIRALRYAIERGRGERQLRLAAKVLDSTVEGVIITDAHGDIVRVNRAFTRITGYDQEEMVGENPRVLQSGRQDEGFYREMWEALIQKGQWRGEIWNRRKNGEIYPEWLTISAVEDERGETTHYVGVFTDITALKETEERLRYLATHDTLTDLPNRSLFYDRLDHALKRARRDQGMMAVMLLDLDQFKEVNDTWGHAVGDLVLQAAAKRLRDCMRRSDTIARMGGDEFTVVLEGIESLWDCKAVAEKLLDILARPLEVEGRTFHLTASIGISLYPHDGGDVEALLKHADIAMYRAKAEGNCYRYYESAGNTREDHRQEAGVVDHE